jgi:hypothetical protein
MNHTILTTYETEKMKKSKFKWLGYLGIAGLIIANLTLFNGKEAEAYNPPPGNDEYLDMCRKPSGEIIFCCGAAGAYYCPPELRGS